MLGEFCLIVVTATRLVAVSIDNILLNYDRPQNRHSKKEQCALSVVAES